MASNHRKCCCDDNSGSSYCIHKTNENNVILGHYLKSLIYATNDDGQTWQLLDCIVIDLDNSPYPIRLYTPSGGSVSHSLECQINSSWLPADPPSWLDYYVTYGNNNIRRSTAYLTPTLRPSNGHEVTSASAAAIGDLISGQNPITYILTEADIGYPIPANTLIYQINGNVGSYTPAQQIDILEFDSLTGILSEKYYTKSMVIGGDWGNLEQFDCLVAGSPVVSETRTLNHEPGTIWRYNYAPFINNGVNYRKRGDLYNTLPSVASNTYTRSQDMLSSDYIASITPPNVASIPFSYIFNNNELLYPYKTTESVGLSSFISSLSGYDTSSMIRVNSYKDSPSLTIYWDRTTNTNESMSWIRGGYSKTISYYGTDSWIIDSNNNYTPIEEYYQAQYRDSFSFDTLAELQNWLA